jgi:hypothetical protein
MSDFIVFSNAMTVFEIASDNGDILMHFDECIDQLNITSRDIFDTMLSFFGS